MKKLLLIGHGYLGEEVVRVFRAAGWQVATVSRSGEGADLACDVGDAGAVAGLPQADVVVHCASSSRGGAEAYERVFVRGCENLVRAFPQARLMFASSTSVYGQVDGSLVTEESDTTPQAETGRLLIDAESIVRDASGLVLRLAGLYGPGRSVVLRKFLSGEAVIEEDGSRMLNQIHRDDAARAFLHLVGQGAAGEVYNVVDSVALTQAEVYRGLAERFGRSLPPSGPRKVGGKRGWSNKRVSNAKIIASGWLPDFASFFDAAEEVAPTL